MAQKEVILRCEIYWGGVDWKSTPPVPEDENYLDELTKRMFVPNLEICKALSNFYVRYYPDEKKETPEEIFKLFTKILEEKNSRKEQLLSEKKQSTAEYKKLSKEIKELSPMQIANLAWVGHQAAHLAHLQKKLNNYETLLKNKLQDDWLLSWHWRALLPSIFEWEESKKNHTFVLKISQVRRWELSVYYCEIETIKTKKKEKRLIRPPIFGISHRMFRWDFYRNLFDEKIIKEIEKDIEESDPFKLANILGRIDSSYKIKKISTDYDEVGVGGRGDIRYNVELGSSVEIYPEIVRAPNDKQNKNPFENKYFTITKPCDLIEIPTFDSRKKSIDLLLSSDNYCRTLSQLTETINDPHTKSVLLIAPSGSGKEALAQAAFMCRDIITNVKKTEKLNRGDFHATSLAGLEANEASKILFYLTDDEEKIYKKPKGKQIRKELNIEYFKKNKAGLVFKSLNGALFLDEIDKAKPETKAMLLRFLESDEVTVPGSSKVIKIPKNNLPLLILSGSMNKKDILEQPPVDLWTRISHVLEMSHPLDVDDIKTKKRIVKSYIWLFWYLYAEDYLYRKKLIYQEDFVKNEKKLYLPLLKVFQQLHSFLVSKLVADFVSDELSEIIIEKKNELVSIRFIRTIVSKAIFFFVEYILYSKSEESAIERLKKYYDASMNFKTPEDWFIKIAKIIYTSGKEKDNFNDLEYDFFESVRRILLKSTAQVL